MRVYLFAAIAARFVLWPTGAEAFDCANAAMPTDFVICSSPNLRAANDKLTYVWTDTRKLLDIDQKKELVESQRAWLTWVTTECGLPPRGRPSDAAVKHAQACVGQALAARTQELDTLFTDPSALAKITRNRQGEELSTLEHLQKRYEDYASDHIENEVDSNIGSGSTYAMQTGKERDQLDGGFHDLLEGMAKCNIKPAYDSRIDDERTELNRLLTGFAAADPSKGYWGSITQEGIRETQKAWQEYRDAWLAFGGRACPATSEEGLLLRLLQQRNYLLRDLAQFLDLPPVTSTIR